MIKTKLTALTLAGLMAVASGAAFAESTTTPATPINKNAMKLPGSDAPPADRNSSNTPGAQTTQQNGTGSKSMTHDKTTHGQSHDNSGVTEKPKTN